LAFVVSYGSLVFAVVLLQVAYLTYGLFC
jgi:hypothetical protein